MGAELSRYFYPPIRRNQAFALQFIRKRLRLRLRLRLCCSEARPYEGLTNELNGGLGSSQLQSARNKLSEDVEEGVSLVSGMFLDLRWRE